MLLLHSVTNSVRVLLVAAAIGTGSAAAQTGPRQPLPDAVPRTVVMLVGRTIENIEAPVQDAARDVLQMPLNHLGLRLVRFAVDQDQPPPDLDPTSVVAVGTWFESDVHVPSWTWPWLERQSQLMRTLHFGSLLPLSRGDDGDRLRRHLRRFGLGYDTAQLADPARIEVEFVRGDAVPFESQPVYERLHLGPWNLDEHNQVWLSTRDSGRPRHSRSPVVSGPWGGIALQPWFVRLGGAAADRRFYVDPFVFLGEALPIRGLPVSDPCVRFGRRVFLLHVDGDGFESVSSVGEHRLCGEVFLERIVDRWQVPMTISVIVAGLTDHLAPAEPTPRMQLARTILSRPWVEAASHSVLHPLDWRKQLAPRSLPRSVVWYPALDGYTHDMRAEVRESIAFVDRWLLPPGKRCRVMLWSGAANPDERALAAASDAGCWNLNGGLFRWDEMHDSVGFVSPWGVAIGQQFQVFAGAPNENVFPGFFTTMPGAFRHVDRTIENTGKDRILKPANVYVHFYSAEHPARLAALETLLERWLDREPVCPSFVSTYAAAVHDCETACTIQRVDGGFRLQGFTHCRTVRFDTPVPAIDWPQCSGLAGVHRIGSRTFVHLARQQADLRFVAAGTPAVRQPHVEQADCELDAVQLVPGGVGFTAPAGTVRTVVLADFPADSDIAVVGLPGAAMQLRRSDHAGRLELHLPAGPSFELRLTAAVGRR